eukprot:TRINITY_DN772_c0_g2_i1.p1 TRINITY_DN772_c0_g2~~TRINITY_DN772_c0_g2_i1.p1  ORF type:complete len:1184 (+),score=346.40 TRINITY_DN772_c0_g2_i1:83-3553(+)
MGVREDSAGGDSPESGSGDQIVPVTEDGDGESERTGSQGEEDAEGEEEMVEKEHAIFSLIRSWKVLGSLAIVPIAVVIVLVAAVISLQAGRSERRDGPDRCIQYVNLLGQLSNAVAEECLLTVTLARRQGGLPHLLPAPLSTARRRTNTSLHSALHYDSEHSASVQLAPLPRLSAVLSLADLAQWRLDSAAGAGANAALGWCGDRVETVSDIMFGALRRSAGNAEPLRGAVGGAMLLAAISAAQQRQLSTQTAVGPVAAGASDAGPTASWVAWATGAPAAGRGSEVSPELPVLVQNALQTLDASWQKASVMLPEREAEPVRQAVTSLGRGALDWFAVRTAASLLPDQSHRQRWARSLAANGTLVNTNWDRMRGRVAAHLIGRMRDDTEEKMRATTSVVLVFLMIFGFLWLLSLVLWHYVTDGVEEKQVQKDFIDVDATLGMLRTYTSNIAVWLLDDIPSAARQAGVECGQMELHLMRSVGALRILRPFVPQWVFRKTLPEDMTEGVNYVEAPKYKQPADLEAQNDAIATGATEVASPLGSEGSPVPASLTAAAPAAAEGGGEPGSRLPESRRQSSSTRLTDSAPAHKGGLRRGSTKGQEALQRAPSFVRGDGKANGQVADPEDFMDTDEDEPAAESTGRALSAVCAETEKERADAMRRTSMMSQNQTAEIDWCDRRRALRLTAGFQGIAKLENVALLSISLRQLHSSGRLCIRESPAVAETLNSFLSDVAKLCEVHRATIVKFSPEAILVGFNMTWDIANGAEQHARIACKYANDLFNMYDERVAAMRDEERAFTAPPPITRGSRVEVREKSGKWMPATAVGTQPVTCIVDGGAEAKKWYETRPVVRCLLEQVVGSKDEGYPRIAAVCGPMHAGTVSTGTVRGFECLGPRMTRLRHISLLCEEFGVRCLVDGTTRERVLRAPILCGDSVELVEPAAKLEQLCRSAPGCEWTEALEKAAGMQFEVQAVPQEGEVEVLVEGEAVRIPVVACRHTVGVHQCAMVEDQGGGYEVISRLLSDREPVSARDKERQKKLDGVFRAARVRRYKLALKALDDYVQMYELDEVGAATARTAAMASMAHAALTGSDVDSHGLAQSPMIVRLRETLKTFAASQVAAPKAKLGTGAERISKFRDKSPAAAAAAPPAAAAASPTAAVAPS